MKTDELPKGVSRRIDLPRDQLGELWDSIVLDGSIKQQLVSQAIVNFTVRPKVPRSVLPLHGAILLVGEPGTGKTTLARGLAHRTAKALPSAKFTLLEIDPHALASSMLGRSQKAVSDLFRQTIAESAMSRATIVLLDEVETLAADRTKLSLEANPVDVHRATDAVLVEMDKLAEEFPNLLFIATSNFPQAIDAAFTSRCDLVLEIPLPNKAACELILRSCLIGLGATFKSIGLLPERPGFAKVAEQVVGLDGRAIRKVVANAMTIRPEVAVKPGEMNLDDLLQAAKAAREARLKKGKKEKME